MGDALYDKEGNQLYSGKGRKSGKVRELLDKGEIYLMVDDTLQKIGGKTTEAIQAEIDQWLSDKQKQERNNCSVCKYYEITHELWAWTKKHGLCTRSEIKEKTLATGGCKYLCRPGDTNEHEEWRDMSAEDRKEIVQEHKGKRKQLQETLDKLLEKGLINKKAHKEKSVLAKTGCKDNIQLLDRFNDAYMKRLSSAALTPKMRKAIKSKRKRISDENRQTIAEFFGVEYIDGTFIVDEEQTYKSVAGLANHLGANIEFKTGKGWVFKYNDSRIGPIKG